MFDLGTQELIVIFLVAFLVFGPKKLPELGRTLGRGIRELKNALRGVKDTIEEASEDVTEEFRDVKKDLHDSVQKSVEAHFSFKNDDKPEVKETRDTKDSSAAEKRGDIKKESDNG